MGGGGVWRGSRARGGGGGGGGGAGEDEVVQEGRQVSPTEIQGARGPSRAKGALTVNLTVKRNRVLCVSPAARAVGARPEEVDGNAERLARSQRGLPQGPFLLG